MARPDGSSPAANEAKPDNSELSLEAAIALFQEFAAFYDVDLQKEPFMLRIIQEASAAPLPTGWVEIEKDDGVYFHNANTGDVTWDHPLDGPTRAKIDAARKAHAAKAATSGGISASVPDFATAIKKEAARQAAGESSNTTAISQQELLSQPTRISGGTNSDMEAKLASDIARIEAEKELAAATRAREAESRERQLLTNMVETMQAQLADARQEARELRTSIAEMEKARQANWDQQMAAQSRISELEAEVRDLKRETAEGGSVAVLQQRVTDAERIAEEERSARLRGETATAQLMGTQAVLYQRISELEAELNSSKSSRSRRSGTRKVVLHDQPVESMRPGTAAGGLIQHASANGGLFRPGTADTTGGSRGFEQQRPSTSLGGGSYDAAAASNREARAQRMGAQVLRLGANSDEDEFEQAFR